VTKVIWTLQAIEDLTRIRDYIRTDSFQYADLVVAEVLAAVDRLRSFPESGRLVPERPGSGLREVLWRSYRIVYSYESTNDRASVLLVFRSERLYSNAEPSTGDGA
jgi:toxin ParE1/3/4